MLHARAFGAFFFLDYCLVPHLTILPPLKFVTADAIRQALILGDFNARSKAFGDVQDNDLGDDIVSFVADSNLQLINDYGVPTRFSKVSSSILDLTLSSRSLATQIHDWKAFEALPTDHCVLSFSVGYSKGTRTKSPPKISWDLKRCDWKQFEMRCDEALSDWLEQVCSTM